MAAVLLVSAFCLQVHMHMHIHMTMGAAMIMDMDMLTDMLMLMLMVVQSRMHTRPPRLLAGPPHACTPCLQVHLGGVGLRSRSIRFDNVVPLELTNNQPTPAPAVGHISRPSRGASNALHPASGRYEGFAAPPPGAPSRPVEYPSLVMGIPVASSHPPGNYELQPPIEYDSSAPTAYGDLTAKASRKYSTDI
uniref:Uncharacterized protein n=1 Tax=Haptolina brevifila TaxID=156173 RepID=A0A7S2IQN2_9EUKA